MVDTKPLHVAVAAPAFPLELATSSFLATLDVAEKEANALRVTDAATAEQASKLNGRLTEAGKKLEAQRVELKRPFLEINKKIDDAARVPQNRIQAAKDVLQEQLVSYDRAQRRIAEEAEKKRLADLKRLEEEKARQDAENERIANEIAEKNKVVIEEIDFDDVPEQPKTEIEKQIEQVRYAPAVPVAKVAGVAFKVKLVAKVTNIAEVPEQFIIRTANEAAIRSTFCSPWKEGAPLPTCPGVTFEIERTAPSTGRGY